MSKVIAVDFDGCLCKDKWPEIGEANVLVIQELKRQQAEGAKLILWTCREGDALDRAVAWCEKQGLVFEAVNDNLPERNAIYGNNCRKVGADEYWDDKSVLVYGSSDNITHLVFPAQSGHLLAHELKSHISFVPECVPE